MPAKNISLIDKANESEDCDENCTSMKSIVGSSTVGSRTTIDHGFETTESDSSSGDEDDNELEEEQRFDAVVTGMKFASLAITDEKDGSVANVALLNPWHEETLRIITGSKEEAHKPLSYLLEKYMNLELDCVMDEHGLSPDEHVLDTQGYIAHNDECIVLAYRCTTSIFDWLTNITTASSEFEIEDATKGYSGCCSSLGGLAMCGVSKNANQQVHAGFYNNFVATMPKIKEHILPLLFDNNGPARRLYVVGHSLGAGIATLAGSYFLMGSQFDWNKMPHSLFVVTAGSPRSIIGSLRNKIEKKIEFYGSNNVQFLRVVRHKDVVATVPAKSLGFRHVGALVHISRDGIITMDSDLPERETDEKRIKVAAERQVNTRKKYIAENAATTTTSSDMGTISVFSNSTTGKKRKGGDEDNGSHTSYKRKIARIPKAFRDNMPDFYLNPMKHSSNHGTFPTIDSEDDYDEDNLKDQSNNENDDVKKRTLFSLPSLLSSKSRDQVSTKSRDQVSTKSRDQVSTKSRDQDSTKSSDEDDSNETKAKKMKKKEAVQKIISSLKKNSSSFMKRNGSSVKAKFQEFRKKKNSSS
eukprot:CAMPEP_0194162566 /NCGR_PEP_ID=MMETSP0152-20130528/79564_1 /TAXON_ID=1049557 /ORGANISM="Thalassiothrix antarctica, Strain L6-D1" /LENGTH=583 /DNA_ID=CAMNT_0038872471 /DNA_START=280 /DNA_END=2031 /DNA_ORIENTATION=+